MLPVPPRTAFTSCYVLLRRVTSCYVELRCVAFTPVHDGLNLHRDCRGKFLNSLKIWHGVHGNGGVSRSPETVPRRCVTSSRFAVVRLKPGYRGCRGPSVNLALGFNPLDLFLLVEP